MSVPAPEALPVGYEFVRLLGRGGNGWVALARQVQLDRLVAIKTIHTGIQDEDDVARLRREGKAIAALRHPNVVRVYELLVSSAGVSLVMEHVPGGDLRHAMDGGLLTGADAVRVLCDVAAGLGHAHSRGIVHRDVKPANVLLSADGSAKLADFGLARLPRSTDAFRTMAGVAAGTPLYMAPEQIEDPDLESASIDAYAFAVLAYEVLVGARPYAADGFAAVIHAHLYRVPIAPWTFAAELPVPVGDALLAGLAKRAADRAAPEQLADRLRAVAPAEWDAFFSRRRTPPVSQPRRDGADGADPPPSGRTDPVPGQSTVVFPASPPGRRPGPDVWVQPAVYRLPVARKFRTATAARLAGVLGGLVIGLIIALVVLHR